MLVIDRIEGDVAILVWEGGQAELPMTLLPDGAAEGAVVELRLNPDATSSAKAAAQARLDRLTARDTLPDEIDL